MLDDRVRPRLLIVEGPMVDKATGETHVMHRVEWWSPVRVQRHVMSVHDGPLAAQAWCRDELERDAQSRAHVSESVARRGF